MPDRSDTRPDLTLTLDKDGVIQNVVRCEITGERAARPVARPALGRDDGAGDRQRRAAEDRGRAPARRRLLFSRCVSGFRAAANWRWNIRPSVSARRRVSSRSVAVSKRSANCSRVSSSPKRRASATTGKCAKSRRATARCSMRRARLWRWSASPICASSRPISAPPKISISLPGAPFLPRLDDRDRRVLDEMLAKTREEGRAPGVVLRATPFGQLWSLRASLMNAESGRALSLPARADA